LGSIIERDNEEDSLIVEEFKENEENDYVA